MYTVKRGTECTHIVYIEYTDVYGKTWNLMYSHWLKLNQRFKYTECNALSAGKQFIGNYFPPMRRQIPGDLNLQTMLWETQIS
jgi:hypothetical protein